MAVALWWGATVACCEGSLDRSADCMSCIFCTYKTRHAPSSEEWAGVAHRQGKAAVRRHCGSEPYHQTTRTASLDRYQAGERTSLVVTSNRAVGSRQALPPAELAARCGQGKTRGARRRQALPRQSGCLAAAGATAAAPPALPFLSAGTKVRERRGKARGTRPKTPEPNNARAQGRCASVTRPQSVEANSCAGRGARGTLVQQPPRLYLYCSSLSESGQRPNSIIMRPGVSLV